MPCMDFTEIPAAHVASGEQDRFELFARDFFEQVFEFQILSEPSRGADGGKDILFVEQQVGTLSSGTIKWLVSCKHKAFSGNSVTPDDERNILDRMEQFGADGFIGFYSTLASSGLNNRLNSYKGRFRIQIFDKEKIESYILGNKRYELFKRYFPKSYRNWMIGEKKITPTPILKYYKPLKCSVCGTDLLSSEHEDHGIIGFAINPQTHKYYQCYAACRGDCDFKKKAYYSSNGIYTAWNDINDLLIPAIYLQKLYVIIYQLQNSKSQFEGTALGDYKSFLLAISQYVFRPQSEEEQKRIDDLSALPDGI